MSDLGLLPLLIHTATVVNSKLSHLNNKLCEPWFEGVLERELTVKILLNNTVPFNKRGVTTMGDECSPVG